MMPSTMVPYVPDMDGDTETTNYKQTFIEINNNFETIRNQLDRIAKTVFGENTRFTDIGLVEEKKDTYESIFGVIGLLAWLSFVAVVLVFGDTNAPNIFNEISDNLFLWNYFNKVYIEIIMFIVYTLVIFLVAYHIGNRIPRTVTDYIYMDLEIKLQNNKTIISFPINSIDCYQLLEEFKKEFKNAKITTM